MRLILAALLTLWATALAAQTIAPRDGWAVHNSDKPYAEMVEAVKSSAKNNKMGIVTEAGPTEVAKSRGVEIPGNRVIGIFNNVYAVRILNLSTPAMIEAPIRMYVTETPGGGSQLSYKMPSFVFAPYLPGADADLAAAASELDDIFGKIATGALN